MDGRKAYRFEVTWARNATPTTPKASPSTTSDKRPERAAIEALLPQFTGTIEQVPPPVLGHQGRWRTGL